MFSSRSAHKRPALLQASSWAPRCPNLSQKSLDDATRNGWSSAGSMSPFSFCQVITRPENPLHCLETHLAEAAAQEQASAYCLGQWVYCKDKPLHMTEHRASSHGAKLVTQGVQQLPTQHDHRSRTKSVQVFLVRTRKQPVPLTDHSQDATCNSGSNPADHIQESGTQIHQLAAGSFSIFVLFTPQLSWVEEQQFFMNCNFAVHGC